MKTTILLLITLPILLLAHEQRATPAEQTDPDEARRKEQEETMEDDDDPFSGGRANGSTINRPEKWRKDTTITTTQVRVEWYDVDSPATIRLLDDWTPTSKADELRKKIISQKSTLLSEAMMFRLDVGETALSETIQEMIYPTEYVPNGLIDPPKELKAPGKETELFEYLKKFVTETGLCPVAFETRNVGIATEAALEPVKGQANTFDLSIAPEKVKQHGEINCGKNGVVATMPVFSTVRSNVTTRVLDGQWHLISIQPAHDQETGTSSSTRSLVLLVRLDVLK